MALVDVSDVLEETGAVYTDFSFLDDATFRSWLTDKINRIDIKVQEIVGSHYTEIEARTDLEEAEIYWAYYRLIKRKQGNLVSSAESGFAIASLRIDSTAGPAERLGPLSDDIWGRVRRILDKYSTLSYCDYVIVEDLEETDE